MSYTVHSSILRDLPDDSLREIALAHMNTVVDCLALLRSSIGDDDVVEMFDDAVLAGNNILTLLGGE